MAQAIHYDNNFVTSGVTASPSPKLEKPTLGVMPKSLWQEARYLELCRAISERYNAGQEIRFEWIEEYNELVRVVKLAKTNECDAGYWHKRIAFLKEGSNEVESQISVKLPKGITIERIKDELEDSL